MFEEVILSGGPTLSEFNKHCVLRIAQHLGINTSVIFDARFETLEALPASPHDTAQQPPLDVPNRKTARVITMCRALGGTVLVNARGGMELYHKQDFTRNGISLLFLVTRPLSYSQGTPEFYPDLSIIDVLMNCGRDCTRELLDKYDLV
jgi:hypothetical protein